MISHQNDEALGFSLSIAKDIAEDNNVKVIIYMPKRTDQGILNIMRGYDENYKEVKCYLVEIYPDNWIGHPPVQKVIEVRQEEFIRTLLILDVKKENIISTG